MEPKVWGPSAWEFLHAVTFQYPEEPKGSVDVGLRTTKKKLKPKTKSVEIVAGGRMKGQSGR